jgi:hypothetical protein
MSAQYVPVCRDLGCRVLVYYCMLVLEMYGSFRGDRETLACIATE